MSKLTQNLDFTPYWPVQDQIRKHVRQLVEAGELEPGERLPSTQKLAKLWDVDGQTVHLALVPLVREGLLTRVNRVGTFVRRKESKLTCAGIYVNGDKFASHEGPIANALVVELQKLMWEQGIEPDIWMDSRPAPLRGQHWPALEQAIAARRMQALIFPEESPAILNWAARLAAPFAAFGSGSIPNGVNIDMRRMAELSVRSVVEQDCRSVGVICAFPQASLQRSSSVENDYAIFFRHFELETRKAGVETRPSWMLFAKGSGDLDPGVDFDRFGYQLFHQLWSQDVRPRSLIVMDNVMAHGVIKAVLERQIRVPDELKITASKLACVNLFAPMPMRHLVIDESLVAQALLQQVQKQFNGESCERRLVAPVLSPLPTSSSASPLQEIGHDPSA
ncbi:MAG: GntR family transcriptional regulator [Phycisphaeraceae bacterium]|nr:GntR family transcriptional regulator [Phycisphaeraceae bacterium]